MMDWFGSVVPASSVESLAAMLLNGFLAVFLLPVLLSGICYFLPAALMDWLSDKARLRILPVALRDALIWSALAAAALGAAYLYEPRVLTLLLHTNGGAIGLAAGAAYALYSVIRHIKSLRMYYYAQVLSKNLSRRQAQYYEDLQSGLRSGKIDAERLRVEFRLDYLGRQIAREFFAGLDGKDAARQERTAAKSVYFL